MGLQPEGTWYSQVVTTWCGIAFALIHFYFIPLRPWRCSPPSTRRAFRGTVVLYERQPKFPYVGENSSFMRGK
jgi:hypothetical protein